MSVMARDVSVYFGTFAGQQEIRDHVARRILTCNNGGLWLPAFLRLSAAVQCPGQLVQLEREWEH